MAKASPFVTDQERGVYFWESGSGADKAQLSTHPHPLLPFHCAEHRWWSDRPCIASHEPADLARRAWLFAQPARGGSKKSRGAA